MISLKTQKIIMLIPFVNYLNLFIALRNCHYISFESSDIVKMGRTGILWMIPIEVIRVIIPGLFPSTAAWLQPIAFYLSPIAMSLGLIRKQKKMFGDVL